VKIIYLFFLAYQKINHDICTSKNKEKTEEALISIVCQQIAKVALRFQNKVK